MIFYEHMSQSQPHTASVTQLCLHWCSAQLSAILTLSPHESQALCVSSRLQQWMVSWDLQRIAIFTEHHVSVSSHRLCAWDPTTSSTQICLHWCSAHLSAVLEPGHICCGCSAHQSQGLSVSSDEAVIDELGCAAFFIFSWWCFMSRISESAPPALYAAVQLCSIIWSSSDYVSRTHVTIISPIRSKCHPVVLALMFCTTERCTYFQFTLVTGLVCRVRQSSGWWSMICIIFHHPLMMFDQHTHLCLHWCFAHLIAVLELGTYVAVVPVRISHKVCIIRFSSDSWSGMRSIFIINWCCLLTKLSQSAATIRSKCHYIKHVDVLALVVCTSERCTGTAHIRCCGSSAHQSQGLHHQIQQWLMIWDAQHIHHQLIVCRVRWSSGWWAWICILFHHQLMMFDEHTQLCLHWCFARLSAVLRLGTNAAVVPVHISHKVCIIRFSSDWWSGMRSRWRFMTMLSQSHMLFIVNSSHKIFVYLFTWSSNWWAGICSILHHHSCWNGLSSLCFWASKTYTLWRNDRYGCFKIKMKRHYGNSSLKLWIDCYKNGR